MAQKSHKNNKHIAELIESATVTALQLLAQVDKFAMLGGIDASLPDDQARAALREHILKIRREDITIADQEAVRLLHHYSAPNRSRLGVFLCGGRDTTRDAAPICLCHAVAAGSGAPQQGLGRGQPGKDLHRSLRHSGWPSKMASRLSSAGSTRPGSPTWPQWTASGSRPKWSSARYCSRASSARICVDLRGSAWICVDLRGVCGVGGARGVGVAHRGLSGLIASQ